MDQIAFREVKRETWQASSASSSVVAVPRAADGGVPIAWCSIAARSSFRALGVEDPSQHAVRSLTWLLIKREFRERGLADQLLRERFSVPAAATRLSSRFIRVDPE